ncbi:MAG TPA: M48 family metallopeptidase [Bryobacteraceae bacterium]|nr:M48 family metallopeptidase [Bryobacteraceae bacterium]
MQRRLSFIIAVLLAASCASRKPGDPIRPGYNLYSPEQDIELGRQAAAQVRQQVDIVRDLALQDYIRTIGQKLASTPEAGNFPYEFTLTNDPSINAFALPGGPVFIHSGLIQAAENEAQVAGVMAHEIAHVALRHGTSQASKANLLQLPAAIAGAVLGQGVGGQLGQIGVGLGLNALVLRYSRRAESEADALGAKIMARAGYNPVEMARFFEKLEAEGGSRAPEFLSDHPNPGNRIRNVQAEIMTFPRAEYASDTGQFSRIKQVVARLPAPDRNVQRARTQPPPMATPSGGFRELTGGTFALAYPAEWEAFSDNQSGTVAIGPRQGFVQDSMGRVSVGYGAILSYYRPVQARNLREATGELVQVLQQSNPNMQVARNPGRVNVSGFAGLMTELVSASPFGGPERDFLLTVARPEGIFYMVFVAPDRAWAQIQPAFEQMVQSIRFRT